MASLNQKNESNISSTIPVHIPKNSELTEDYVKSLLANIKKQRDSTSNTNTDHATFASTTKVDETSLREQMKSLMCTATSISIDTKKTATTIEHDRENNLQVRLPTNSKEINEDFVKHLLSDYKLKGQNTKYPLPSANAKKTTVETSSTLTHLKTTTTTNNLHYVQELKNTASIDTTGTEETNEFTVKNKEEPTDNTAPASMKSLDSLIDKIQRDVRNWKTTATSTTVAEPCTADNDLKESP